MNCIFMLRQWELLDWLWWDNGWALFRYPNGCPQPSDVIQLRMVALNVGLRRVGESGLASKVDRKFLFLACQAGTGAGEPGALAPPAAALEPEEDVLWQRQQPSLLSMTRMRSHRM